MTDMQLTSQLKVLYIEDDEMTRGELSRFLKKRVGKLLSAESCETALALLDQESVDLIISDLRMPGMTGIQLIGQLRANGCHTPVIITSAFSDSETILQAVDLGIVKYVVKPIDVDMLMKAIEDLATLVLKDQGTLIFKALGVIDRPSRLALEKQLKSELAHQIKRLTGKGPKDISVFLKQNRLEVQIMGGLTLMEQQLVKSHKHHSLLCAFRRSFYESSEKTLCAAIAELIGGQLSLNLVVIDLALDKDTLVFDIA